MSLQCGIVGLPNVGKSTLFNCLSNAKAQSANFPFCTIEPNVGVITVPDERLIKLGEICKPERGVIPTTVEIVDIAGLVKGASKGEGLGNKFLANIRETDAIIHVLRCFDDENVVHVDGSVNPVRDKEIIDAELQLKDLEAVESRIQKCEKAAKAGGDKNAKLQLEVLVKYREALSQGKNARTVELDNKDQELAAKDLFLLTNKPVMYVCNVDEASAVNGNAYVDQVREAVKDEDAQVLVLNWRLMRSARCSWKRLVYRNLVLTALSKPPTRCLIFAHSLLQEAMRCALGHLKPDIKHLNVPELSIPILNAVSYEQK